MSKAAKLRAEERREAGRESRRGVPQEKNMGNNKYLFVYNFRVRYNSDHPLEREWGVASWAAIRIPDRKIGTTSRALCKRRNAVGIRFPDAKNSAG